MHGKTMWQPLFLFFGEFSQPGEKKKRGLANPTKGFLRFFFFKSPYLDQNKLEVTRFKQCVLVGHQN